jgi:hypothetical protein
VAYFFSINALFTLFLTSSYTPAYRTRGNTLLPFWTQSSAQFLPKNSMPPSTSPLPPISCSHDSYANRTEKIPVVSSFYNHHIIPVLGCGMCVWDMPWESRVWDGWFNRVGQCGLKSIITITRIHFYCTYSCWKYDFLWNW